MFAFLLGSGLSLVCYAYGQPFQPATRANTAAPSQYAERGARGKERKRY